MLLRAYWAVCISDMLLLGIKFGDYCYFKLCNCCCCKAYGSEISYFFASFT